MANIQIFTKRSFEFKNAEGGKVVTKPLEFNTVPDWVRKDPILGWGVKDGSIRIIETTKAKKAAEKEAAGDPPAETNTEDQTGEPPAGDPPSPEGN